MKNKIDANLGNFGILLVNRFLSRFFVRRILDFNSNLIQTKILNSKFQIDFNQNVTWILLDSRQTN